MSVRVVAISDAKNDPLLDVARDWLSRCDRRIAPELVLIKPKKKARTDELVRREEGAALLKASEGTTRVVLDAGGREHDSRSFARALEDLMQRGRDVAFLIGGASGHDEDVRAAADTTWSLSRLTFPHRLAVLVVCEQLYRSSEIARGGPYAK
jgi:23S rRNA (pseudouridine1915-N3)-methyltransferase